MSRGYTDDDGWMDPPKTTSRGRFGDKEDKYLQFDGEMLGSTAKAWKFEGDTWSEFQWIPKSQTKVIELNEETKRATIQIKEWLCEKNGWKEI